MDKTKGVSEMKANYKEVCYNTWTGKTLKFKEIKSVVKIGTGESIVNWTVSQAMSRDEYRFQDIPLEDGDVIIDIGAQLGEDSLILTTLGKKLNVYAYEPVEVFYESMLWNVANNLSQSVVRPRFCALGDKETRAVATWAGFGNMVRFTTLDKLFEEEHIDRCKILKIDCEGCEYPMLEAASKDTLRKIDYIVGEHHFRERWELHNLVLPFFADNTEKMMKAQPWQRKPTVGLFFFENYDKSEQRGETK